MMPDKWWEIALLACLPGLFLLLVFCWLIYLGRGKRAVSLDVSVLGLTLKIGSREQMSRSDNTDKTAFGGMTVL